MGNGGFPAFYSSKLNLPLLRKILALFERKIKSVNAASMTGFIVVSAIAIMIVTCIISGLSYKSISSLSSINLLSLQKNQELKHLDDLVGRMRELHSNVRDYVLTSDSSYIKNTTSDKKHILSSTKQFSDLLTDDHAKRNMILLRNLIERKIGFNENILRLYQLGGRDIALEFIETGKASVLNDSIELVAGNIKEFENRELETSVKTYNNAARQTRITILVATALIIFLGFLFMITTVWNLQRRAIIMDELEKAKEVSEKTAFLKSRFVSNMSHEIRTPLNSIVGFTNLLAKTRMDSEQADFVKTIKNASENLLTIVNDVLDFSKIEAGMMRLEPHEFSIDEVLENLRKLFEHSAGENNLKLEFKCDETVPLKFVGDANRLNQILVNLVGNAIKFTEKGSVTVRIKANETLDNIAFLEFKVKDTGVGIPRDKLPKIFDRFEQVDNNSGRKNSGTGLGLSIVKSLVELEGGSIRVSSIEGDGTEFAFTVKYQLPLGKGGETPVPGTGLADSAAQSQTLTGKVLVVEDNPINQKLAGFILRKWNIDFDFAPNGRAACNMLKQGNYKLVLMDIQMPEMDGYQATKVIREEMKLMVPIVALTAHAFDAELEGFTKAGMDGYITKPFKEEELYAVLAKFLEIEKREVTQPVADKAKNGFAHVIDFTEVEKISGGNKVFVKELAEMFVSQIQLELVTLENALTNGDLKTMQSTAHSMKSTVGYMGLMQKLEPALNSIELCTEDDLTNGSMLREIEYVKAVCHDALMQLEVELPEYIEAT